MEGWGGRAEKMVRGKGLSKEWFTLFKSNADATVFWLLTSFPLYL